MKKSRANGWLIGWAVVGWLAGPAALAQRFQLSGQVLDQQSRQPIEYANVSVWANDSVLVAGTVTDGQGKFRFKDLAANFGQFASSRHSKGWRSGRSVCGPGTRPS
jgi:hypothetical protein